MADERLYSTSDITILLHNETSPRSSQVLDSPIIPNSTSFLGENNEDESFDGFWLQSGKKRRLSVDQVQFLEKNFEIDNKLEPERKIQLAKELGLQPRQVAIWFQNRRARFKTKQLEKDYTSLKTTYDSLKSDYQNLLTQKDKLKTEVRNLKQKLAIPEKGKQQEEASSAKSVVFDSSDNLNSSMADSSHGFEPDLQSECFSQHEQQNLRFPKLETCYYDDDPTQGCCNLTGFQIEDQALAFWPY